MNSVQIVNLLNVTGHMRRPFGRADKGPWPTDELQSLELTAPAVEEALASYQQMHAQVLEPLIAKHHPQRRSSQVYVDGRIGPATAELLAMPRCECADYDFAVAEPAQGSGSWRGCHGIGNFHSCKVKVIGTKPSFLAPVFDQVWERVVSSYDELGLHFEITEGNDYNTTVEFVTPNGGWIGLAIVGSNQSCSSKIWSRYDRGYQPSNIVNEWTTLIKHELGHNCGLQHSNGGVMNPYIVAGLPISWKADPSFNLLKAKFGGQAIPKSPDQPKVFDYVVGRLYNDGTFEKVMSLPQNSTSTGPFPIN